MSFWVRPSQKNQDRKTPIYLRLQLDGVRTEYSIGQYVLVSHWDSKAQKVKGLTEEAESINGTLGTLKARALKIYNEMLISGEPFNSFTIKDKLINGTTKAMTFNELMEEHIQKMIALRGKSFSQPTIVKYRNSQLRISQYVKKRYKRNDIYLYELNFDFIDGFEGFLKTEFNNSNTTCAKHFQRISRVVRIALNRGYINRYPFGEYKPKLGDCEYIFHFFLKLVD